MTEVKNRKVELFLDSGAYSAWSQGKKISIDEYITFIKKHEDVIDVYANLDVITSAERTWRNQQHMEKAGLSPLPVYHFGEDIKWLTNLLERKYPYIGLGGMVPISTQNLVHWLDDLFKNYLTDSTGIPIVKVHGFGLTSLRLMLRYPWYSVDSTSWVLTGRMGSIYIPKFRNGKWVYNEDSWKVQVSNRSPQKDLKAKHLTTMSALEKKIFMQYITEKGYKFGKSEYRWVEDWKKYKRADNEKWVESKVSKNTLKRELEIVIEPGVCNMYQLRDEMNILYFVDLEKSMPTWPWPFKTDEIQKGFM